MLIQKWNTLRGAIATALLLLTGACSATPPTAPSPTAVAFVVVPNGSLAYWSATDQRTVSAFTVDDHGVYTDVTGQTVFRSTTGRISLGLPSTANGPFTYLTSVPMRPSGPGADRITAAYQGMTDAFDVTISTSGARPRPYLDVQLSSTTRNSEQEFAPINASILANMDGFFGNVTAATTLTSSNPNVAVIEGSRIRVVNPGHFILTAIYNGVTSTGEVGIMPLGVFRF